MTKMRCTTFENSIEAIERETTHIRVLLHELREHRPHCAPNDNIDSLRKKTGQMHVICKYIVQISGTP